MHLSDRLFISLATSSGDHCEQNCCRKYSLVFWWKKMSSYVQFLLLLLSLLQFSSFGHVIVSVHHQHFLFTSVSHTDPDQDWDSISNSSIYSPNSLDPIQGHGKEALDITSEDVIKVEDFTTFSVFLPLLFSCNLISLFVLYSFISLNSRGIWWSFFFDTFWIKCDSKYILIICKSL